MKKQILMIISIALALCLILGVCAVVVLMREPEEDSPDQETTETTVQGKVDESVKHNLPDDLDWGGAEVMFLIWSDHTMEEFYTKDPQANEIAQELYYRNLEVETQLGITISYTERKGHSKTEWINALMADSNAQAREYDIYATYSRTVPPLAMQGYLADLNQTKYIDLDKPWWPDALMESCSINDKLYFISGDISTNLLWMMEGFFCNKQLAEDYNLFADGKNVYDLVLSNEWTYAKMFSLVADIYTDLNPNEQQDHDDFYGMTMSDTSIEAFFNSSGMRSVAKDADDYLSLSEDIGSERLYDLIDDVRTAIESNGVWYEQGSVPARELFTEQRAIMTIDRLFVVAGKDNHEGGAGQADFNFYIAPVPKFDEAQKNYYTTLGYPYTLYAVNAQLSQDEQDKMSAVLECLACENYNNITPVIFEKAMKLRYSSDEVAAKMYDIMRENVVFDMGRLFAETFGSTNSPADLFVQQVTASETTLASRLQGYRLGFKGAIDAINKKFQEG